jgi:hypothetical protein
MPSISLYGLSGVANVTLLLFTCPNSLLLGTDPDECVTMQGGRVPELSPVEDREWGSVEYSEFRVRGEVRVQVGKILGGAGINNGISDVKMRRKGDDIWYTATHLHL